MASTFDQYSTARPMMRDLPIWIADDLEKARVGSYQFYEMVYWTVADTFKLIQRGTDTNPLYVPAAKTIVETLHRYLAPGLSIAPDPAFGADKDKLLATQVIVDLVRRERLYSRFTANKRYGIIRGDWFWHLYADPLREPGARISVFPLDPSSVFPIENPDNSDEVIGYHIVEPTVNDAGEARIRRLTYRKTTMKGGPSPITVEDATFKVDDWGGPGMDQEPNPEAVIRPPTPIPAPIDHLPIYHMQNFMEPNSAFGSSELRGFERIIAGLHQGLTDEDLSLALEGLGVYATTAGAPLDPTTKVEMPWNLGPGRVVEIPQGETFNRVDGNKSMTPYQEHLRYMGEQIMEASGTPKVARGNVDVQVAESGIALTLEMGPLLSRAMEKETVITDVMNNLLFDLSKWYIAYEGTVFNSLLEVTRWVPSYGDRLPVNVSKRVEEINALFTSKLLSGETSRNMLRDLGFELPDETTEQAAILGEQSRSAAIANDAFANRVTGELGAPDPALNVGA